MIDGDLIVEITEEVIDIEFVAEQGPPGAGASSTSLPVVISETDPQLATPPRSGPLLWVQPNVGGASLRDIFFIPAA